MIDSEQVEQIRTLVDQAQSIFVMFGSAATIDHVAVAVALQQALHEAGKDVVLLAPTRPNDAQIQTLSGLDLLTTEIGNQNLSVSFPYDESAVDKVSYHIGEETQRFYLTIKPKKGAQPLNTDQVQFSYSGAETDLIFLIGVPQLSALKDLYVGYEDLYTAKPVVTVHSFAPDFGTLHLDTSGTPSMSEAVVQLLQQLGLAMSVDVATNLLTAIESLTKGFQSLSTTADTFETVAQLLRMGARRVRKSQPIAQVATPAVVNKTPGVETSVPVEQTAQQTKPKKKNGLKPTEQQTAVGTLQYKPTQSTVRS